MTEMVSSNDIEDVLSSIRRLVSITPGRDGNLALSEDVAGANSTVQGRFVLTEDYRVPDDDVQGEEPAADHAQPQVTSEADDSAADAVTHTPEPTTPEDQGTSDTPPTRRILRLLPNNDDLGETSPEQVESGNRDTEDPDWNSAALFFSSRSTDDDQADEEPEENEVQAANTDSGFDEAVTVSTPTEQPVDMQSVRALEETIAELEQAVGAQSDEWEPDGSDVTGEVPDRIVHFAPPRVDTEPDTAANPGALPHPVLTLGPEDAVEVNVPVEDTAEDDVLSSEPETGLIDEDTLHDLVTEIVRQELQGALGERITRNVRKLVRREIQIALAAEKLD